MAVLSRKGHWIFVNYCERRRNFELYFTCLKLVERLDVKCQKKGKNKDDYILLYVAGN